MHGLCFVALLFYFLEPPRWVFVFLLSAVVLVEALAACFVSLCFKTEVSELLLRQKVLGYGTTILWGEDGVRVGRGVLFRFVRAPGMRFIMLPTRLSALKANQSWLLLGKKIAELKGKGTGH